MRISGIPYVQGRNRYNDPDGTKYGIAIHNTSNNASALAEASYATRRTDGVSSHLYADRTAVIQSIDTKDKAGHAGSANGNNHGVAVEITGTNDKSRQWWIDNVNWTLLGSSLAQVCRAYGIAVRRASVSEMQSNPKVKAFYSHDDMRRAWGGTTHTDPGGNFPWDYLFGAINRALAPPPVSSGVQGDDDMKFLAQDGDGNVYVCDFIHSRWVDSPQHLGDIVYLSGQYGVDLTPHAGGESVEWTADGIRKGWVEEAFGVLVGPRPPVKE